MGNTLVCDNIANATAIAKTYGNLFKIVTLDGDTVATSGAMTGGSRGRNAGSLMSNERKIQECRDNIARKQKLIEKLKVAIANSERERREAEEDLEKFREKYQGATSEIAGLVQRETALTQQITEADGDIQTYVIAHEELKRKLREIEEEEASSTMTEEEIAKRREAAAAEMERQREQYEGFKNERAEKSATLKALEGEYATLTSQIEQHKETVERLTLEKEDLVGRIVTTDAEKTDAESKLKVCEAAAEENELTEEEKAAVQEIMDEIAKQTELKDTLHAEQISLDEERTSLQETLTKSSACLSRTFPWSFT